MSKEYPCIYFRPGTGGLCSYGGDLSEANICVFGPCENETQSNGDRIRAMSDEELAGIFPRADFCKCCEHEKGGVCNFICAYPNIPIYEGCKQAALAWMKQPVEVDT